MFRQFRKLWIALLIMMLLSPLGLIATGTAFGEWGLDELQEEVGFIPQGLARLADFWQHSPMPDYSVPGAGDTFIQSAGGYMLSAAVGILLVIGVFSLFSKIVKE